MPSNIRVDFISDTYWDEGGVTVTGSCKLVFHGNDDQRDSLVKALNNTGDFDARVVE